MEVLKHAELYPQIEMTRSSTDECHSTVQDISSSNTMSFMAINRCVLDDITYLLCSVIHAKFYNKLYYGKAFWERKLPPWLLKSPYKYNTYIPYIDFISDSMVYNDE